jgi:DNA-directed RNA polymerase omega subunit
LSDTKNLEKCLEMIPSRFALATVATKRWEQLKHGARPMVESSNPQGMNAVFREIETGKLSLNMAERLIEKHGVPIPAPPPAPVEEPPSAASPAGSGEAA